MSIEQSNKSFYEVLGGAEFINRLVDDFYQRMRSDKRFANCLSTHDKSDFMETALKLKYFLTGWLGGPQLYMSTYGHPRLRMRHFPFSIGKVEADEWLLCMEESMKACNVHEEYRRQLFAAFTRVTEAIKNRDEIN